MPTPKTPRKRNKNGKLVQRRLAVQNEGLGKLLYGIREKLQLSQYEMADRVGISRFNMSRLEKGPVGTSLWDKRWRKIGQVFPEIGEYLTTHGLDKGPVTQRERDGKEKQTKAPSFDAAFAGGYQAGTSNLAKKADPILKRLDDLAEDVQSVFLASQGEDFTWAKGLVNSIDSIADDLELAAFGKDSHETRMAEVLARSDGGRERTTWRRKPSHSDLLKKADLAAETAKRMLRWDASEQAIEDQAVALMALSDMDLVETFGRLQVPEEG